MKRYLVTCYTLDGSDYLGDFTEEKMEEQSFLCLHRVYLKGQYAFFRFTDSSGVTRMIPYHQVQRIDIREIET